MTLKIIMVILELMVLIKLVTMIVMHRLVIVLAIVNSVLPFDDGDRWCSRR